MKGKKLNKHSLLKYLTIVHSKQNLRFARDTFSAKDTEKTTSLFRLWKLIDKSSRYFKILCRSPSHFGFVEQNCRY